MQVNWECLKKRFIIFLKTKLEEKAIVSILGTEFDKAKDFPKE